MTPPQKPVQYLGPDLIKLESSDDYDWCGWDVEVLALPQRVPLPPITVTVRGHADAPFQQVIAIDLKPNADRPVVDVTLGCMILDRLNRALVKMSEDTPMYGEHDYVQPVCETLHFASEGLPPELKSLAGNRIRLT